MLVRFWGTRGSLAKPGPATVRYGGNTACVEVRVGGAEGGNGGTAGAAGAAGGSDQDGTLIVLDCGTGAHELGQAIVRRGKPVRGHLLITHTHWDHIQGFPFFAPLFIPGNEWDIYAPGAIGQRLEATLAGQMEYQYFPVTLDQLGATIRFHDLVEGTFQIGGVTVTSRYLNHPAVVLSYRLEAEGVTLVYATDHEPHEPTADAGGGPALPVHAEDRAHIEFLRGADLVIHDAQYTLEEYGAKRGWGHTAVEQAADFAALAGADRLAFFHHDPARSDEALDALVVRGRERAGGVAPRMDVFAAAEGMTLDLGPGRARRGAAQETAPAAETLAGPIAETVLIADDDPDVLNLLADVLEPEGLRLLLAADGEAALRLARAARPSLILLDWQMPGRDGLSVLRELRGEGDAYLKDVPVVLLTARNRREDTAEGFSAGATDYLTKPFTPANVRSRVREWLLRTRAARGANGGNGKNGGNGRDAG